MFPYALIWLDEYMLSTYPDNKVHVANMGPTWVLSSPGEPHAGPMNLSIGVFIDLQYTP